MPPPIEPGEASPVAGRARAARSRPRTSAIRLQTLQRRNARCRRCLEAGFPIVPRPIFAGRTGQRAYLFGLAPGRVEAETGLPWQGRAGRTLRRWLRLDEETFFHSFYCASVTRCFPGPSPSGRGDRRATRAEEALCESWRNDELRLLRPLLVVTVGLAPATHLLGIRRLTDAIGKSFVLGDAIAVPLPHPSGASGWLNEPANRARLGKAITHVRRELARVTVA
jgi:uracil-DNA glycosylase family 4